MSLKETKPAYWAKLPLLQDGTQLYGDYSNCWTKKELEEQEFDIFKHKEFKEGEENAGVAGKAK